MKPSQATAARTDCWLTKLALLIRRFFEFSAHDLKWNLNFGKTAYADQIRRSIGGTLYCLLMMMAFHCQTALADTPYNVIAQFTDVSQTFGGGSNYGTMTIQGTFYINASSVVTSISGATIQYGSNPAVSLSLVSANSLGGNDNKFFPSVSPHVTGGGLVLNDGTRYLAWIVDAGYSSGSDPTNEWLENYGSSLPSDPFMVAQPVSLSALAIPSVTGLSPASGPSAGGTSVTITGSNLTGVSAVKFGASNATSFNFVNDTQVTAVAPAGSGQVDVTVTTSGGTSVTGAGDQFTYIPTPTVTSLSVSAGPTAGGTSVVVTGTNFTGATVVKFGASNASSFNVNSATQITATAPAGSTGAVDITVTTPGGTSSTSASDVYTYVAAPTVTSLSVTSGSTAGGTSVVITGTNFTGATAVKFGSTNATSYTVNSATQITATAPAGSAGTVDVTVVTAGGTSATSASDQYTYAPSPAVTSLSVASGPTAGGTSVIITGTNFTAATAVKFGATNATSFTVNSATQITATSPSGSPGTVDVTVTTVSGISSTAAADQFTYVAVPTVSNLGTSAGPTAGGNSVVITGTNFSGATAVKFGANNAASFNVNSATQITATAPAGSAGAVDITVTTPGGTSATSASDVYTYVAAPTVTSLSVTSGSAAGGTSVVITGTNFTGATAVKFGSTIATSYAVNSATQITATAPAGSAGTVDVTVVTAGGTSATSASDQY
ncbi:MAG: IPT/TIG domain-containing protein, partial [Curvibacter sp.]|nr:IPT/TIG domain-containing protein [Curvibacter sp.]